VTLVNCADFYWPFTLAVGKSVSINMKILSVNVFSVLVIPNGYRYSKYEISQYGNSERNFRLNFHQNLSTKKIVDLTEHYSLIKSPPSSSFICKSYEFL